MSKLADCLPRHLCIIAHADVLNVNTGSCSAPAMKTARNNLVLPMVIWAPEQVKIICEAHV